MYKLAIIIAVFILGLCFVTKYNNVEGFDNKFHARCPNILIQKGSAFFLYNSKLAKVPGVNPLRFNNLDDYVQFMDWQRSQGIRCPVLYLQESYDAQGNSVLKGRPSPTNLQGGLPDYIIQGGLADAVPVVPTTKLTDASRNDPPYNKNSYPGFDGENQDIGATTPLDKMFHESGSKVSDNPMDTNWGGLEYTQSLVDAGHYDDNQVSIAIPT
jgi:hypothetical protein